MEAGHRHRGGKIFFLNPSYIETGSHEPRRNFAHLCKFGSEGGTYTKPFTEIPLRNILQIIRVLDNLKMQLGGPAVARRSFDRSFDLGESSSARD